MESTRTTEIHNLKFTSFVNDSMASYFVDANTTWEPHITKFITLYNSFNNINNIIDVGANFGYHTLLFSTEVTQNVFAFEPQAQNFKLLEKNIKDNKLTNIIPYNLACGDVNCDIQMPFITDLKEYKINMGDFTPNIANNINETTTTTKSVLLDEMNFTSQIDLIKIDVQGWEKKVLLGASNILRIHKPILIVEFEWFQLQKTNTTCQELFDFIRNNNYHIFYLEYQYPSDHVCVHNDNLTEFRNSFKDYIFPHTVDNDTNNNIQYGIDEKIVVM